MEGNIRMKSVSCVIVTYNRLNLLKECIDAILNQTVKIHDIIVIDNCSTDETETYLTPISQTIDELHYYRLKKNLGGAGGFNYGLKKAYQTGNDFIWIMDDDTIPQTNALEKLLDVKEKNGFLCSNVKWTDNSPCLMNIPQTHELLWLEKAEKALVRVNYASFVSLFIRTDVIEKVGYPITDFFIWGDDVEFTYRVSKLYPCFFVADSIVIHKMKTNSLVDILSENGDRINRYYFNFRNSMYTNKKLGSKKYIRYIFSIFYLLIKVIMVKNNNKFKKLKVILKGFFKGLTFNPQIEMPSAKNPKNN
jgi:GT2 family glycosyltransferase